MTHKMPRLQVVMITTITIFHIEYTFLRIGMPKTCLMIELEVETTLHYPLRFREIIGLLSFD